MHMKSAELKLDLFRRIDRLKGPQLQQAYGVILNYLRSRETEEDWNDLSEEERNSILKGLEDYDKGDVIPHHQVVAEAKAKYGRRR